MPVVTSVVALARMLKARPSWMRVRTKRGSATTTMARPAMRMGVQGREAERYAKYARAATAMRSVVMLDFRVCLLL